MKITHRLSEFHPHSDFLRGRVVLVTGSGQGLGRAIALAAAAHGATVILHGRNIAKLEKTYDSIVDLGGPTPALAPLDFSAATDQDFANLAQMIEKEFRRCDAIIHCAASLKQLQPLSNDNLENWLTLLRVNLAAPYALTRACLPLLKQSANSSVVFVSESHGLHPAAYWGGFAVSKFALQALLQIWCDELASSMSPRMNIVVPGPIQSPQRGLTHPAENKATLRRAEDVAPAFLYLLAEESKSINAQVIELNA